MEKIKLLRMVIISFSFILMLSISSCKNEEDQMRVSSVEEAILKQKAIRGSEDAYMRLSSFYIVNLKYDKAYISKIVADKYHDKEAYSTLSWCLLNKAEPNNDSYKMLKSLDKRTQFLCLYYLLKARELGKDETDAYYRGLLPEFKVIPSSNVFLDSLKSIDSVQNR